IPLGERGVIIMLRISLLIGLALLALVPFAALAQGVDDDDDFTLQVLRDGATLTNDVLLVRSTLDQQPGSTVGGEIEERSRFLFRGAWLVFGLIFWLGATLAPIVRGLLVA